MQIIDGRKIRDGILESLKERVASLPFDPVFCDVLVGTDPVSEQYVRMKERTAESIGITALKASFPESITTDELITEIKKIALTPNLSGLIIQLPLPSHIDTRMVLDSVPLVVDVDSTSTTASERFYAGNPVFVFPTAEAVLTVLKESRVDLAGKKIVVVGQGALVGKPVTHLLESHGLNVAKVASDTADAESIIKSADVLISAVGKPHMITKEIIQKGALVVDAGTSEYGGVSGDIDPDGIESVAEFFAPVPGGVGPVTVAMLMRNVVQSAEQKV